jgi:hypothetical protein
MSLEQECGKDVREIEEFKRREGNATDAGELDPSSDAGIAPQGMRGGRLVVLLLAERAAHWIDVFLD